MKQFSRRSVRRRNSSGSLAAADSAPAQVVFFSQDQQFSEASTDPYRFPNSQATSLQTEVCTDPFCLQCDAAVAAATLVVPVNTLSCSATASLVFGFIALDPCEPCRQHQSFTLSHLSHLHQRYHSASIKQ
eukprot:GHRR01025402.1.p1 GENE.GHRR01025402.1~~GHRR01025402.1.p1  ORF type:complete len:131 (+),score=35.15 GHRR01025402.1:947-1339(+)